MTTPPYVATAAAAGSSTGIVVLLVVVILAVSVGVALVLQRRGKLATGPTREQRLRESETDTLEREFQEQQRKDGLPPTHQG
jgi:uncharacterized protein HemX